MRRPSRTWLPGVARLAVAVAVIVLTVLAVASPALAQIGPIFGPTQTPTPTAEAAPAVEESPAPSSTENAPSAASPESRATSAMPEPALTPCTRTAKACVDLTADEAWLMKDGTVIYGPVPIRHGAEGKETPVGTFEVQWKHKDHFSSEYRTPSGEPSPMPYSVFFADGGIAFHEGSLDNSSGGCVRLRHDDAVAFFDALKVGDQVQVHKPRPPSPATPVSEAPPA